MPTYEYECKSCGNNMEEFQQMSENPLVICPNCKEESLVRLITGGGGVIFKGGDWPGQTLKRKNEMTRINNDAGKKSRDSHPVPKFVPNINGEPI